MGFGILFLGYALTFGSAFSTTYIFGDIIGCILMLVSFALLWRYDKAFKRPAMATGFLTAVYAASAALRFMGYGNVLLEGAETELLGEKIYTFIQSYVMIGATLLFYITLLYAIAMIAVDVGLTDISRRCVKYMLTFVVYAIVWVLFDLLSERIAGASVRVYNVMSSGLTLFSGIWLIMMAVMIMSCMKWIAPAEVLEAEARGEEGDTSVLTKIGTKLDKIQETMNTPREEKEARKLKSELEHSEKLNEKDKKD